MGTWLEAARRRKLEIDEKDTLIARLRMKLAMPLWAELDSGASIAVGYECRYMLHEYRCITAHTKALTRRPTNTEYWESIPDFPPDPV